ncbi:hypothetical protein BKA69DRAFT_642715 [Paraphysoderma sedebokerense]|nr:hypothetical protein BKA69DRAFT_642715 [Paraphysoderma sedebokerense]
MTDLEKMDQRICELHKKHDDMQSLVRAKEEKLSEMQDQLDDLRKEAEIFNGKEGATEVDKEIHQLENRLDKAHIKFNEAQSIRKTYEQIVKKLQEERLTFDHQLAQFERTLKTKRTESSEIETMNRDANHAKEMAKAELTRFETQINEERKFREKDLQVRKEQVRQKIEASEKFEFRLLNTADTSAEPTPFDAQKDTSDYDRERQISQYEETIRLIKEAMGVSNLNEVIQKFQSQWDTHTHLAQLQIANEQKIEELKKKRKEMHDELMEAKFNGEGKHNKDKGIMEEFEKHLEGEMARCADLKIKYERVVKLMNNAKAGLQHIMDKLESVVMQEN